jgi:hypothetical protein
MKRTLKLFVWKGVLCDYTSGVMFALAHDVEEARKVIQECNPNIHNFGELIEEPEVYEKPYGYALWGGG